MSDMGSITAIVSSLKTAVDIAKALRDVDLSVEQAEAKLRLADLSTALADTKLQVAEIKELLDEKNQRIAYLEDALSFKAKVIKNGEASYEVDEMGNPKGMPYCSHCLEVKGLGVHLHRTYKPHRGWQCTACQTFYERYFIRDFEEESKTVPDAHSRSDS